MAPDKHPCLAFLARTWQLARACLLFATWKETNWTAAQEGQKAIYHLEAFVARFMSDFKVWTINALG